MATQGPRAGALSGKGMSLWICATRWNEEIVDQLIAGAAAAIEENGGAPEGGGRRAGGFVLAPPRARGAPQGGVDGILPPGGLGPGATEHYSPPASRGA